MEYEEKYAELRENDEGAYIPFTVLGDPDIDRSRKIIKTLIDNGADILELGMPFTDPIADGPTIQTADTRALRSGVDIDQCMDLLANIRSYSNIPIGLLMYSNLILNYGVDEFYKTLNDMDINSVLIADVPLEEADDFITKSKKHGVETVFLITPITEERRIEEILARCSGFVYLVARLGVTGARKDLETSTLDLIERVRPKTDLPLNVGFGISKPEHVEQVIEAGADGAITGSALIDIISENLNDEEKMLNKVAKFTNQMKEATII